MKRNLFIEHRQWIFFWGLFTDGQEEVQKVLTKYNQNGWYCVQFDWDSSRKLRILKILWIAFITILTLGFAGYFSGFSIVFERDDSIPDSAGSNSLLNSDSRKKETPVKTGMTLNDLYRKDA